MPEGKEVQEATVWAEGKLGLVSSKDWPPPYHRVTPLFLASQEALYKAHLSLARGDPPFGSLEEGDGALTAQVHFLWAALGYEGFPQGRGTLRELACQLAATALRFMVECCGEEGAPHVSK